MQVIGLPQWSSGQNSWLQIQRSRVRFLVLPEFLRSNGSERSPSLGKDVTAATKSHARIEELLDRWFSMRSLSYQRRVGNYLFPKHLVILKYFYQFVIFSHVIFSLLSTSTTFFKIYQLQVLCLPRRSKTHVIPFAVHNFGCPLYRCINYTYLWVFFSWDILAISSWETSRLNISKRFSIWFSFLPTFPNLLASLFTVLYTLLY
jgi:hypothetical protein